MTYSDLYARPYLNVYFVDGTQTMEKYLGVTRAAVKDWAKPLVDHGAEWLIIVLTKRPETSMLGSK